MSGFTSATFTPDQQLLFRQQIFDAFSAELPEGIESLADVTIVNYFGVSDGMTVITAVKSKATTQTQFRNELGSDPNLVLPADPYGSVYLSYSPPPPPSGTLSHITADFLTDSSLQPCF